MKELTNEGAVAAKVAVTTKINPLNKINFKTASVHLFTDGINLNDFYEKISGSVHRFKKATTESYVEHSGFVPPFTVNGVDDGDLCHFVSNKAILMKFRCDVKKVPKRVLEEATKERLLELASAGDGVVIENKLEVKSIQQGVCSLLLGRAFPTTTELWVLITDKFFVVSSGSEKSVSLISKKIREQMSFPILPLSVLSAKNLFNESVGVDAVTSVSTTLDKLIDNSVFSSKVGNISKSSFTMVADGAKFSVENGDASIPNLI